VGAGMNNILQWLEVVDDIRQPGKVKHLLKDIIALVFFASLANADEWTAIHCFGLANEKFLRKYLELPHGIPSHDTIQRVFALISPGYLQEFRKRWDEVMSGNMGNKIRKILGIDGKTQCGNGTGTQKANHIVSAVDEDGFCLGEVLVDKKSNEITAIPLLLKSLNIKGHIVTTDAMGCQTNIVAEIRKKQADYVLALKGNHGTLYKNVVLYFDDPDLLCGCAYKKVCEKAHGGIEKREYWQTDDISWLEQKKEWSGLRTIAMTKNTITQNGVTTTEVRYFISSISLNVEEIARAIRGHWMVESYHWHLDVTFREDANHTLEKDAAYNLNIMKKMAINTLKLIDVGVKRVSLKNKRYMISMNFEKYFGAILEL
jgi:predicted transposase YbfD/YdcC